MKKIFLFLSLSIGLNTIYGQRYIKVSSGVLSSSYANDMNLPIYILSDRIISTTSSIGIDYRPRQWGYLSSSIGYYEIGGKETNGQLAGTQNYKIKETAKYLTLSTSVRITQVKVNNWKIFLELGSYGNIFLGQANLKSKLYFLYCHETFFLAGQAGIGVTREFKKLRLGLLSSYIFNITPSIDMDRYINRRVKLRNNTFPISIELAYRLKR